MATNHQSPLILAIDPAPSFLGLYHSLPIAAGFWTRTEAFAAADMSSVWALYPDLTVQDGPWNKNGNGWDFLAGLKNDPTCWARWPG
jgi:hypothetical protein